jgi:fatty-acyl-CoA synthase
MIKSMNIAFWVQRWRELHPEKPAVIFDDRVITYRKLHGRSNRTASWLQALGIEKGDRVAVMLMNSLEFIEVFIACSRLGAIFVPINYRVTGRELNHAISNAKPRVFIFHQSYMEMIESIGLENQLPPMLLGIVGGDEPSSAYIRQYNSETCEYEGQQPFISRSLGPSDPEEPQVIMYTSGTTGAPKGAVLSHRKTFFNCLNAEIFFRLNFDDIMLIVLPLFHSGGLFIQAAPTLYKGATILLHSKFDPLAVYRDIEKYRVSKFLGVPTVFRSLLHVPPEQRYDVSSLKTCAGGGEKTSKDLFQSCKDAGFGFRQIMGQTETSILLWASEDVSLNRPGTVGRPVFHAEVSILDRDGTRVKPGEIGEIVVRGSIMMKEYWQDPEQTDKTIKNGFLHTGDLAYVDQDGYYYLVDRVDDMYISGGENVYPAEVETVLREMESIEDVAVVGMPDDIWGFTGHAFIIPRQGCVFDQTDIQRHCHERLARYKLPKQITVVKELPRTALGKVRKTELRRQLET